MRICKDCQHFHEEHTGQTSGIWYNLYCLHPSAERVPVKHPQTGEKCYMNRNSLGGLYTTDEKHPNARDINPMGECQLYEAKEANRIPGRVSL